jgi:hypothetical protein
MMLGGEEQPAGKWISVSQVRPDTTHERGTVEYKVTVKYGDILILLYKLRL